MANVSIKFNNKEFLLACEDGQEEHLEELLIQINKKFNNLKNDLGNLGENKLLLITAVKIMDEYYDCLLYTSPSPRDYAASRMPSSA